jgi:hypothetical protein
MEDCILLKEKQTGARQHPIDEHLARFALD